MDYQLSSLWDFRLGFQDYLPKRALPVWLTTGPPRTFDCYYGLCRSHHQPAHRLSLYEEKPYPLVLKCLRVSGITAFFHS